MDIRCFKYISKFEFYPLGNLYRKMFWHVFLCFFFKLYFGFIVGFFKVMSSSEDVLSMVNLLEEIQFV